MTDMFSIGQLLADNYPSTVINLRWTLTTGQFSTDQQLYCNRTTERKEKITSPRFAFLIISANAHLAHFQSRTSPLATQALQKSQIFHRPILFWT